MNPWRPCRAEEVAFLAANVRADYMGDAAPAVAAACSHQPALLHLAAANLQRGTIFPQVGIANQ